MRTSKYFSDKIILIFAVCVVLSFLCQIFKFTAPVNILYVITLLLVLGCYLLSGHFNVITLAITVLVCFAAIVNGFRAKEMDYYTHILITICIFMCIGVSSYVQISSLTFIKIVHLFFVTTVILLLAYYFGPLKSSYFSFTDVICLNFPNPNAAGLWLTCFFVLLLYSASLFRSYKRAMYTIAALALLPIIIATQSRNSFLACLFFIAGLIVSKIFHIKRVPNWCWAVMATLPLIVFAFYMFVIVENMDFWEKFFSLDAIDKGLGTRVSVWQNVIDNFAECFFFGDYYRFFNSQPHNSLLTIFLRFGAPATVFSCITIYQSLKRLQAKSSFYAAFSLSAILFTGCFEASVFVGIAGMYLMLLLIPACASVEKA